MITIGFFLKLFGIGKFHCDVRAIPESTTEKPVSEESDITEVYDSSEDGTYSYNGTKSTTCPCGWRYKNKV